MEHTIIYLVLDREYLKTSNSTLRTIRFSRYFDDVPQALNYILNSEKKDCIIVPMYKDQYMRMYERNEKLCI